MVYSFCWLNFPNQKLHLVLQTCEHRIPFTTCIRRIQRHLPAGFCHNMFFLQHAAWDNGLWYHIGPLRTREEESIQATTQISWFKEMCRRVQWPLHIRMLWGYYICRRRVPSGALWNSEGNIVHEQGQISLFHEISRCPFHQNLPHQKKNATVVYHQVQTWLGWDLPLTEWGWIVSMDSFRQFLLASL